MYLHAIKFCSKHVVTGSQVNHAKLQPIMLIYRQLTVAVLGCEIWSNISLLCALEYMLLHLVLCTNILQIAFLSLTCGYNSRSAGEVHER